MSHTPGPWEAIDDRQVVTLAEVETGRTYGYGCENDFVCDLNDSEYHQYRSDKEQAANARLIAAAPELLEALNDLLVWADWHSDRRRSVSMDEPNTGALEKARAALAKATGEGA